MTRFFERFNLLFFVCVMIAVLVVPAMGYSWSTMTLENGSIAGKYGSASSLSLDTTGTPGISYLATGENLNYTWWSSGWGRTTVDNQTFGTGYFSSLKYNSLGYPSISYTNISGLFPYPPPSTGWVQNFVESPGWYSFKMKQWGDHIYVTMTDFGVGAIWRYSESLGWEPVVNGGDVINVYDLEVFNGKIYGAYAGVDGGIIESSDGSFGSFAQVFSGGGNPCNSLAVNGGKIYAVCGNGKTIISSPDGTVWSTIYTELDPNKAFFALESDGSNLYLGQSDTTPAPWQGDILSSSDGVVWVSEGYPAAGEQVVGIDYIDGNLYVGTRSWIGGNVHIFRNGAIVHTATGSGFFGFCGCDGLLFAAGSGSEVLVSTNGGSTWTSNFIAPIGGDMMAIGSLGKRVYAGSSNSLVIFATIDPIQSGGLYSAQWNGAGWDYTVTDPDGAESSLAINSTDYPKVAYVNKSIVDDLYFSQWSGTAWEKEKVDVMGSTAATIGYGRLSLALNATENASISYYNVTDGNLKFAQWDGTAWVIETVDSVGDVGLSNSLAFNLTDRASISYYNATSKDLKFAQWDGTNWFNETVDSVGDVGLYTSLAIDSCDFPHISYFDNTNKNLKHAWRNNSGWFTETIDTAGNTGYWSSIGIEPTSNNMFVSYFNQTDSPSAGMGQLRFAYALGIPPALPNIIYGLVLDDNTGMPINGATVNIRNATHYTTNLSFHYGGIDGVYWFENLPANENYFLNATKLLYTKHADVIVNTGVPGSAIRQDLFLTPAYTLTLNIRDITSSALITSVPVGIVYTGGSTTTSTGTAIISALPPGYVSINATAAGYNPYTTAYLMTSDLNATIYMTPITVTSSIVWYAPHPVRIIIVNEYGRKIQDATISANFNSSTMPAGWATDYYGINSAVVPDILNKTLFMTGITGSDGSVVFTMQQALQYNLTIYDPGTATTSYVKNFEAKEEAYTIHIQTIPFVISNYITYQDPLTISEPDIYHIMFNINWTTNSTIFDYVNFTVISVGNGTIVHNNGNANTSAIMNFTVTNIRGEQWLMTESAHFTDGTWMNVSRGVTAKGPSGVLVDLGLPNYYMYQWIAYLLIFALGSMASQRNAHMFAILVPVWAAMLVFFGWIPGGQIMTIIGFCVAIGAFIYMRGSLRQKFGISGGYSMLMSIFLFLIFFQACIGIINGMGIFTNNYAPQMTTQYSNVDIGAYQTQYTGTGGLLHSIATYTDLIFTFVWSGITLLGSVLIGVLMITYFLAQVYPFIPPGIWVLVQIGDWVLLTMFFFTLFVRPSPGTPGTDIT